MANPRLPLVGVRFGRLVVLAPSRRIPTGAFTWHCRCDCGVEKEVRTSCLRDGTTVSCGCLRKEKNLKRSLKHGAYAKSAPDLATTWSGMKQRCFNPNTENYRLYGGRGITICDRWLNGHDGKTGLECFIADMGPKPSPDHTVDRWPDNNGNYEPGNCRWATMAEQNLNKRSNGVRVPAEERISA